MPQKMNRKLIYLVAAVAIILGSSLVYAICPRLDQRQLIASEPIDIPPTSVKWYDGGEQIDPNTASIWQEFYPNYPKLDKVKIAVMRQMVGDVPSVNGEIYVSIREDRDLESKILGYESIEIGDLPEHTGGHMGCPVDWTTFSISAKFEGDNSYWIVIGLTGLDKIQYDDLDQIVIIFIVAAQNEDTYVGDCWYYDSMNGWVHEEDFYYDLAFKTYGKYL